MPRLSAIGFAPAATFLSPSRIIACARRVAVVVPSPATSLVFVATSFISCAPMFSNGSSSSISFAITTPSFVISGAPNFLSSTTLRPFGPKVILTVSASWFMPHSSARRASSPYFNCLAILFLSFRYANSYSTTARISFWRTMMYSSPSSFTSVPAYLE
ncbi:MAG: hypothetical protein BWY62_00324 [Firmicutes bacterium ADurb.Bin356]|nr:MAG: hypothetical protein BWY62_00324 [Firmicutes bacterium ADurb.Bin356]